MTEDREKLMKRLQKLKALSECPTGNVNECASAAARMQELMIQHGLEMAEIDQVDEIEEVSFLADGKTREPLWKQFLLNGLAPANQCHLTVRIVPKHARDRRQKLQVFGSAANLAALKIQYDFLCLQVARLWKGFAFRPSASKLQNAEWHKGVVIAILDRLTDLQREAEAAARAKCTTSTLAVYDQAAKAAKEAARERLGETTHKRIDILASEALISGLLEGQNIDLHANARLEAACG